MSSFDPNAFLVEGKLQQDQEKKSKKFDPDAFLAVSKEEIPEKQKAFSPAQALIRKYGEGLTGGLSTPIVGAIQGALTPGTTASAKIRQLKEESKAIGEQYPSLSLASELGGIVTPQGLFGKVAGWATKGLKAKRVAAPLARMAGQAIGSGAYETGKQVSGDSEANEAAKEIFDALAFGTAGGVAGEAAGLAGKGLKKGGMKLLASLRGVSQKSLETYEKNPQAVNEAITLHAKNDLIPAVTRNINDKVKDFVVAQNQLLDDALANASLPVNLSTVAKNAKTVALQLEKDAITPIQVRHAQVMKQQADLLATKLKGRLISAVDANDIKRSIQAMADDFGTYTNTGFKESNASKAIRGLASEIQASIEKVAPVKEINQKLSQGMKLQKQLGIENVMKPNGGLSEEQSRRLLATLTNDAKSVLRTRAQELDDLMGTNLVEASSIFASARDLATSDLMSTIKTGRSVIPMLLGGAAGGFYGDTDIGRGAYGLAGMALGSPYMTRPLVTGLGLAEKSLGSEIMKRGITGSILKARKKSGGQ